MKRFLLLALTASLISPLGAKANTHDTRDICARHEIQEITTKQALRKLNLSIPRREGDRYFQSPETKVIVYCRTYYEY